MSGVGIGAGAWINLNPINNGQIVRGIYSMPSGPAVFSVTGLTLGTANYVLVITISNLVDGAPRHLHATVTAKSATGFSFQTEQTTNTADYKAEYVIIKL